MFTKGKALLISVLGSIILMAAFTAIESIVPFENIFHYSSAQIGWHTLWIVVLLYFIQKNKENGNDKKIAKTLWIDFMIYAIFPPVGAQKSIYDILKFKAQKAGLPIHNNMLVYMLAILLYVFYIVAFIGSIFFNIIQSLNLKELNSYISEINVSTLKGGSGCGVGYQPKFIESCIPNTEQGEIILKFNSYPYWLYGVKWNEVLNVRIDGKMIYFTTTAKMMMDTLETTKEQYFTKCLNPPDADNTAEEQMVLCQCSFNVLKNATLQNMANAMDRKEMSENFDKEKWGKEVDTIYRNNIKDKCGHLIHHRKQE